MSVGLVAALAALVAIAAVTTAVLSLDATAVLLTPVVFATAARIGVRARPHVDACTHLANSASLPVSNLTHLLAFRATGLGFARFGFVAASAVGIDPAWVAGAGAAALAFHSLARRRVALAALGRSLNVPFPAFVLALGVVVRAVIDNGLSAAVGTLVPRASSFGALLVVALVAALLANVVHNLPAILLLPLLAGHGAGPVLAGPIGVNVGPNLT